MKYSKIIIITLLVLILSGVVFIGCIFYNEYCKTYVTEFNYGNKIERFYYQGKVRLKNGETNKYITPKLDYIFRNLNYPITVYAQDLKRGYLDQKTGEILIDAKDHHFTYAWEFDQESGLAAVVDDNLIGFIDITGKYKISPKYQFDYTRHRSMGFRFRNGYCTVPGENGKLGIIDTLGNFVTKTEYVLISNKYSNGLRIVASSIDSKLKYGLIDSNYSEILPTEYENIKISIKTILVEKEGLMKLLSYDDPKIVLNDKVWDKIETIYYIDETETGDGNKKILPGYFEVRIDWQYGIIDKKGNLVLKPEWDSISCLSPNVFAVVQDKYSQVIDLDQLPINLSE